MGNSLFISVYKVIDRKLIEIPGLFNCFNEKQQHEEMFNKAYKVAEKESFNQPVVIESGTDYGDLNEFSVWINGEPEFNHRHWWIDFNDCRHDIRLIDELQKFEVDILCCKLCDRYFFDPPT